MPTTVRPPDFTARVRFLSTEEGGRASGPPFQGYRCDVRYPDDPPNQAWMIWPTFLDGDGRPLPMGAPVPIESQAQFLVANKELRDSVHRQRIRVGTKFYLVEGAKRVADCTVTELLSLAEGGAA